LRTAKDGPSATEICVERRETESKEQLGRALGISDVEWILAGKNEDSGQLIHEPD